MSRLWAIATLAVLMAPARATAGKEAPPPPLTHEYVHPSGAFSYKTPEGWQVHASPTDPDAIEAGGDGLLVRFLFQRGEAGYDSLHVTCMMERLAPAMDTEPQVKYEYDFLSGVVGDRRGLDSAFVVKYDKPILGHREWRQRNVTLVGHGQSICAISYAPAAIWKKSAATRSLLNAVLESLTFR